MTSIQTAPNSRRGRRSHWVWLAVGGLVLISGSAFAYLEQPWKPKSAAVAVEVVSEGPVTQALAVNGRVAARQAVNVRSAVSGQAMEVGAEEGASVLAGDVLLQLDASQPQALLVQSTAALDAGLVRQQQAQAIADRARALGDNATRSAREDAELSLTVATNEVSRLRAAVEQAQSQLAQYTITAPLSGVVLNRSVDRGQIVDTQTDLFTVADLSQLLVETDVDEIYSSRIHDGLIALLRPAGDSVPQNGTVIFAAPTVDPATGGRAVKIAFDSAVDLPVGLTVNANIIVSQTDAALSVPRSAIVTEGSESHLLLLENGIVEQRVIAFSDWPAERVIVTSGLSVGDVVILNPSAVSVGQAAVAD